MATQVRFLTRAWLPIWSRLRATAAFPTSCASQEAAVQMLARSTASGPASPACLFPYQGAMLTQPERSPA